MTPVEVTPESPPLDIPTPVITATPTYSLSELTLGNETLAPFEPVETLKPTPTPTRTGYGPPKTGDDNSLGLYMAIAFAALCIIIAVILYNRKPER